MTTPRSHALLRLSALGTALGAAALLSACVVQPLPQQRYVPPPQPVYQQPQPVYQQPQPVYQQPQPVYQQPAYAPPAGPQPGYAQPDDPQQSYTTDPDPVVSVYVDPPMDQPEPIAVQWAPPPMLVEVPPPQPYYEAVWTGGYWAWEGRWFWSAGRWAPPPRPQYQWVQPYYEHRADVVIFVPGFWCAPERHFVPPAPGLRISMAMAAPGVRFGRPPMGPQGVFVPPPPGSRAGIIVPAPIGTPPAVVVSAPAVVNVGMRVRGNGDYNNRNGGAVGNVTVEAPAGATSTGQAFQNSVPARAQQAAALAPAGRPMAPRPTSGQAIPTYVSGHQPMPLPAGQPARNGRYDRGGVPNGGARPGFQQPAAPQPAMQPPQGQQPGYQGQQPRQGQGQGRPEFDQPPRQPVPVYGQPQPGQPQGQVQPTAPQQGQPQPANPQDPRYRGRGGNPGQPGAQPVVQPGGQPGAQPGAARPATPGQQPPVAAKPQEAKEKATDERRKPERESKEDREKKNGDRDR